jgi:predicted DNA-binding mobile mystery protein A
MNKNPIEFELFNCLMQLKMWAGTSTGWIRAIRQQKGMQGKVLARKMRVSPARISVLEKDELRGAVTLQMMQKTAEALDCTFVYALVPKAGNHQEKPRIRLNSLQVKGDSH